MPGRIPPRGIAIFATDSPAICNATSLHRVQLNEGRCKGEATMKLPRLGILFIGAAIVMALELVPVAGAQDTKASAIAAAPLPEQLATATSVFISYGGADGYGTTVLKRAGS